MLACCFLYFLKEGYSRYTRFNCAAMPVQYLSSDRSQQTQRTAFALSARHIPAKHKPANPPAPFLRKVWDTAEETCVSESDICVRGSQMGRWGSTRVSWHELQPVRTLACAAAGPALLVYATAEFSHCCCSILVFDLSLFRMTASLSKLIDVA